jgi:hypothetical protein
VLITEIDPTERSTIFERGRLTTETIARRACELLPLAHLFGRHGWSLPTPLAVERADEDRGRRYFADEPNRGAGAAARSSSVGRAALVGHAAVEEAEKLGH